MKHLPKFMIVVTDTYSPGYFGDNYAEARRTREQWRDSNQYTTWTMTAHTKTELKKLLKTRKAAGRLMQVFKINLEEIA